MGRGRGASAKDNGGAKVAEKPLRTTRGGRKSYVEDEGCEEDCFEVPSSPDLQQEDSESDFAAESSGSEYGKKKIKVKVTLKKSPAKRGRKPAGKAQLSPKKRGRKPKVAASPDGKRKRPAESSEDKEEKSVSSPGESEDEVSASGDTSGSEYGKKKATANNLKKEKATLSQQENKRPRQTEVKAEKLSLSDYYVHSEKKRSVFTDSKLKEISNFTNFDTTGQRVYFSEEDHGPEALSCNEKEAIFNAEYPGCWTSRYRTMKTVCGQLKIEGKTIRPFQRVQSSQPLVLWVLLGEIVLKTNAMEWIVGSTDQSLALQRLTYKAGEAIILPPGIPFSLENHTNSVVKLGYNSFDT